MLWGAPTIAAKPRRCDDRGAAEWMNEYMNEWIGDLIKEYFLFRMVTQWLDGMNERVDESFLWMNEWMNEWMNTLMNEWMNEWKNEWMNE